MTQDVFAILLMAIIFGGIILWTNLLGDMEEYWYKQKNDKNTLKNLI